MAKKKIDKPAKKTSGEKPRSRKKSNSGNLFNQNVGENENKIVNKIPDTPESLDHQDMKNTEAIIQYYVPPSEKPPTVSVNRDEQTGQKILTAFDKTLPIYLQIHKGNIFSIFASAIISPSRHIRNRAFPDAQSVDDHLLKIANGAIRELDNSQVLIELNLTASDYEFVEIQEAIALLKVPLPISRIKSIYVADTDTKKDIITKALTGDGGIIPDSLVKDNFQKIGQVEYNKIVSVIEKDFSEHLRRFDRMLGAFAFVKNYSFLLANKTDSLSALPGHFFYMTQAVNDIPVFEIEKNEKAVQFYKRLFGIDKNVEQNELRWIFSRLNESGNFTNQDVNSFGDVIFTNKHAEGHKSKISDHLTNLADSLKRKQTLGELPDLPDQIRLYLNLFGSLRIYGNVNTEDKSISRKELPALVTPSFGEYIFACLGYFYGYTTLRNFEDKFVIKDKYLSDFASFTRSLALKFELNTLLDYCIIESVFQTVFSGRTDLSNLTYLTSSSIKKELTRKPKDLPKDYTFYYTDVLGKFNFTIKKKAITDRLFEELSKLNDEIPVISDLGVYCWRAGIPKNFPNIFELLSNLSKLKYIVFFKKADLIDAIKNNKLDSSELMIRIESDNKFQER